MPVGIRLSASTLNAEKEGVRPGGVPPLGHDWTGVWRAGAKRVCARVCVLGLDYLLRHYACMCVYVFVQ